MKGREGGGGGGILDISALPEGDRYSPVLLFGRFSIRRTS